jgi:hypothetical protein
MKTLKLLATVAALGSLPASADPLPKPIADLECLVGTWKGNGTLAMGKDVAKVDLTWTCRRTSAQHAVACNLKITGIPGMAAYEETDLFGYEPNTSTYHWFSVTNAGETHDHVTKAPAGNKVQFVYTGTQEGKPFKEVIDFEFGKAAKTLAIRAETFVAGSSTSVFDLKAKK